MIKLTERMVNWRNCSKECSEPIETEIVGVIPNWIKGTLFRNGAGLKQIGQDKFYHMFDGMALIHRFAINNGRVQYQSKFLRSDAYKRNIKANRIVVTEFGTRAFPDPCKTIWQRFAAYFSIESSDNDNINILPIGDQLYAVTETNFIRRIDPKTLDTYEKVDLSKYVTLNTATAHAHSDDKYIYNFGSSYGPFPKYKLIRIPNSDNSFDKMEVICSIPIERPLYPSYYHTFSMTENYIVFIEQPLLMSIPLLAVGAFTGKSYLDALQWRPELMIRFYVIRKIDGHLLDTKYLSKSFMFLHTINAFEDSNQIVMDLCCYFDNKIIEALKKQNIENILNNKTQFDGISEVRRFVLPLMDYFGTACNENIVNLNYTTASAYINPSDLSIRLNWQSLTPSGPALGELPRINYKFNGKKYRYFYSICQTESFGSKLMKFDLTTKELIVWEEEYAVPSEPIFVGNPCNTNDDCEDEGAVLSVVLSELDETIGYLLILDAKTFKEIGRAVFKTESSIPGTIHGMFV